MSDGDGDHSLFALKFNIPSIKSDSLRWNKEWDKVLHTLSASEDVYPVLSQMWDNQGSPEIIIQTERLKDQVCKIQGTVVNLWDQMEELGGHFVTAWLILDEAERKRHLLKGLEEACERASWGHDARALCPEITFNSMLKQHGQGFIDLMVDFSKGKKEAGEENLYFLPSEWWQKAVDTSEPLSEDIEHTFRMLTIQRGEFIARFLLSAGLSVLHDLSVGSPGMSPVIDIIQSDGLFAQMMGKTLSSMRDKPLIRCENCAKSSEEAGVHGKFMVCSACKTKLDFSVHYCSAVCQKENWRSHKRHCGNKKVLKNTKGTIHDPFWEYDGAPDWLIPPESARTADGNVQITSLGFGTPHPSRPHSPALQRQVALLTNDKAADYFLFDEQDQPVRVVIHDSWTKLTFRNLRSGTIFSAELHGLEALAEYVIKIMSNKPGLSRERILDQFTREYEDDIPAKVMEWEGKVLSNGYEPGDTFVEMMSRNLAATTPRVMEMYTRTQGGR